MGRHGPSAAATGMCRRQPCTIWAFSLLALLALSVCPAHAATAPNFVIRQRARQQLQQLINNNNASTDVYKLLQETQQQVWGTDGGRSISDLRSLFTTLPTQVIVEVKLVGFDGSGGDEAIPLSPEYLLRHLESLQKDLVSVVLQPHVREMLIKPSVQFQVTQGSRALLDRINLDLGRAAQAEMSRPDRQLHEQLQINYHAVDRAVSEDAANSRGAGRAAGVEAVAALTIYLLNPRPPGNKLEEYLYTYEEPGQVKAEESKSCPGTFYVSSSSPAYVWIDVRAGPHSYGPGGGHKGQVHAHTLPHPLHYKKHLVTQAIIPDLAALTWSAVQHMAWPPVLHSKVSSKPDVLVHVVHIHDTLGPPADRVDQEFIGSLLKQALGDMQKVEVKESFLSFAHCDLCVSIYASALKVRTARDEGDVYLQARAFKVLDRMVLHQNLREHKDTILTGFPIFGSNGASWGDTSSRHVIPVFVFDVSEGGRQGVLIDGLVKATAFSDMVIAVSSRAEYVNSHFKCKWSQAYPSASNVTREVLASVLSAGWGVPDTAVYYSGAGEGEDYRWSVGNTPFSPLSHHVTINAPLAQSARRNLILAHLDDAVNRITRLLDAFAAVSKNGKLDRSVALEQRSTVLQRLNMAHFKLAEAVRLLGQWHAPAALKMAQSLQHDVEALEKAGRRISMRLDTGVVACAGATTLWDVWWAPVGALALWPLAYWVRGRLYTPKAEKIY